MTRSKKIKAQYIPQGNKIGQGGNPDHFYDEFPAWSFAYSDKEKWQIDAEEK